MCWVWADRGVGGGGSIWSSLGFGCKALQCWNVMYNIVMMKREAVDSLQPSVRCRCSVLDRLYHSNAVTRATSNHVSIALFSPVFWNYQFNSFNKMSQKPGSKLAFWKKRSVLLSPEQFGVSQLIDSFVPNCWRGNRTKTRGLHRIFIRICSVMCLRETPWYIIKTCI